MKRSGEKMRGKNRKILFIFLTFATFFISSNVLAETTSDGKYQYTILEDNTVQIDKYLGEEEIVEIPNQIDGKDITIIGQKAFMSKTTIESIEMPNTIETIELGAFADCSNLTMISLSSNLKVLGDNALQNTKISSITFPTSLEEIGVNLFIGNTQIRTVTIPKNVSKIGSGIAMDTNIREIVVNSENKNFTAINGVLFTKDKTELVAYPAAKTGTSYTIPSSVKIIGEAAFTYVSNLTSITIPNGVEEIGESAFSYCDSLVELVVPKSVTLIEMFAFYELDALETLTIHADIEEVPYKSIAECDLLDTIIFDGNVGVVDMWAIYRNASLEEIYFNGTLEGILNTGISYSPELRYIEFPEEVDFLNNNFYYQSNTPTFTVPDNLTLINDGSYRDVISVPISGKYNYDMANEVVTLVNEERFNVGVSPLKMDAELTEAAMQRAKELALYYSHTRPTGAEALDIQKANGENIAANYTTAAYVVNGWMGSYGHKANILRSSFQSIGVGCYESNGIYYWVQLFSYEESNGLSTKTGVTAEKEEYELLAKQYINFDVGLRTTEDDSEIANPMKVGETKEMEYTRLVNVEWGLAKRDIPKNLFQWESLNPTIATIDENGTITALKDGTATIRVTLAGVSEEYIITIGTYLNQIVVADTIVLDVGEKKKIDFSYEPSNALVYSTKFVSWDKDIVTVDENGILTGVKEGEGRVTIFANAINNPSKTEAFDVIVTSSPIEITSVSTSPITSNVYVGDTLQLKATIKPTYATISQDLTWTSSNTSVATVDNTGKVTAKAIGSTTITATTSNGKTSRSYIYVIKKPVAITGVTLNETTLSIGKGTTATLTATINPSNTTDSKTLTWTSSNTSVATVDSTGRITAKEIGETTITVKTSNGKTATCKVTVNPIPITSVTLNKTSATIEKGSTLTLSATINPSNTTDSKTLTWTSSNTNVATVDSTGKVTAKGYGTVKITVKTSNGKTATCTITVPTHPITSVTLNKTSATIEKGSTLTLSATINPSNTTDSKALTWTSNSTTVATVDSTGKVTAKGYGTATITVKTSNGKTATCTITVPSRPITSVTLNKTNTSIQKGSTTTLTATINPSNTTDSKTLSWTSSNTGVATIDSTGKITAKTIGTTTITVKTSNGKTATCTVKVVEKIPNVSYRTHVEDYGWQNYVKNGAMSGTEGEAKRLEGINIKLENLPYSGGVQYRTHIEDYGWEESWKTNGAMSGTSGEAKRLEAIQIQLTGEMAKEYDIYYRVHAENVGWLDWAKNGAKAGTAGYAYRLEGIEIVLVEKGGKAPGVTSRPYVQRYVHYQTHVEDYGWQGYKYDGEMSGTSGEAKRLEGVRIYLDNPEYSGNIEYRTHIEDYGWESSFKKNGEMSGTSGEAKRLEAIEIKLTGEMAKYYDVYYRVHAENFGWLGWAKNGAKAGTAGYAYRLEGLEVVLVKKGGAAPGSTSNAYFEK